MNAQIPHALLEAAVYSADYGIIVVDINEQVIVWNNWVRHHSGIDGDEAVVRNCIRYLKLKNPVRLFVP